MTGTSPTIEKARNFVQLICEGGPPSLEALVFAVDDLVLLYRHTPSGSPAEDDPDPPQNDWAGRARLIGERFPDLGYYSVANPLQVPQKEQLISDAISDLEEIAGDLEEVLWRAEYLGVDDAHWHFRLLFEIHWGRHARELSLYLHAKLYG